MILYKSFYYDDVSIGAPVAIAAADAMASAAAATDVFTDETHGRTNTWVDGSFAFGNNSSGMTCCLSADVTRHHFTMAGSTKAFIFPIRNRIDTTLKVVVYWTFLASC